MANRDSPLEGANQRTRDRTTDAQVGGLADQNVTAPTPPGPEEEGRHEAPPPGLTKRNVTGQEGSAAPDKPANP